MKTISDSVKSIEQIFEVLVKKIQRSDLTFITVEKNQVLSVLAHLRDIENYTHLVMITAVDYIEQGKFQILYLLHNYKNNTDLGVKTFISREDAQMYSAHHLWGQVATYQRELHEMFGIDFPGSPRVHENFALEGWEGMPPMRRDFDTLRYSHETYNFRKGRASNDPKKYMKKNLHKD